MEIFIFFLVNYFLEVEWMMKYFVLIMLLISSPAAFALDDAYYQKMQEKSDSYNQNVDKLPGIIKFLFGNEKINVELTGCQSKCDIGLQTSDGNRNVILACKHLTAASSLLDKSRLQIPR